MITIEMVDWFYRTNLNQDISFYQVDDRTYVIEIKEHTKVKSFTIGHRMMNLIRIQYNYAKGIQI